MDHLDENAHVTVLPPNKEKIKKLWTVAGILGIVTAVEFVIAFTLPHGPTKTFLFVALTIVKAGYISPKIINNFINKHMVAEHQD